MNSESVALFLELCSETVKTASAFDDYHSTNLTFNVENKNNFFLTESMVEQETLPEVSIFQNR